MSRCLVILSMMIACALLAEPSQASLLVISAGSVQGESGQDVEVPIKLKGAKNLQAFQFRLTFDPAVLEVKKIDTGEVANSGNADFDTDSQGHAGMGLYGADPPISADGVVIKVLVHVKGAGGQKSPLTVEFPRAWSAGSLTEMLVKGENGEFTVVNSEVIAKLPSWWWIPVAALGGLLLLVLLARLLRRSGGKKPKAKRSGDDDELPTFGTPMTFKHHCTGCNQVIELPSTALGKSFKCAGCGAVQVGGR